MLALASCQAGPVPHPPARLGLAATGAGDLTVELGRYASRRRTLDVGASVHVRVESDSAVLATQIVSADAPVVSFRGLPAGPATVVTETREADGRLSDWAAAATEVTAGALTVVDLLEAGTGSLTINATILDGPVVRRSPPAASER